MAAVPASLAVCLHLSYASTGRNVAAHGGTENQGNSGSGRMSRLSSQWDCLSERSMNKEAAAKLPLLTLLLVAAESSFQI